jgi:beta-mannosidase
MTCGPWKPIYLEIYESRIKDLSYSINLDETLANADVTVVADVGYDHKAVSFDISIDGRILEERKAYTHEGVAKTKFHVQNPQLWWPFTHGSQPLYVISAKLLSTKPSLNRKVAKRFGIRKVELIQRELKDADGTSFFFQINNIPMWIAGSCWIPADSFLPRVTPQKYYDWVTLARSGNQAMIRVWGGGIYEHDAFYDACDELGVLVWQDFMFACGNYPAYPTILESIALEAEQNIKRLRHHPSIVIWAGNNEDYLYMALAGLEYDQDDQDPQHWLTTTWPARYIYEHVLANACKTLCPDIPYHPGSPYGGLIAMDDEIGDIHQWGVWHLQKAPYQDYGKMGGRFVSEFGMHGYPVRRTFDEFFKDGRKDKESSIGSKTIEWHTKATGAEETMNG